MNNTTFLVASFFACTDLDEKIGNPDPFWRENIVGCRILLVLQDMYKFRIKYDIRDDDDEKITLYERHELLYPQVDSSIDIYVKPMAITGDIVSAAYPIEALFLWSCGFTLRRADYGIFRTFYSEPFCIIVWESVGLLILIAASVLYILRRWEIELFGFDDEVSFIYELLVALATCSQHYMPVTSPLLSRRSAYFCLCLFAYVMYSFYTSNLLSHLVSDRDNEIDLKELADSSYQCVVLENMKLGIEGKVSSQAKYLIETKFPGLISSVNLTAGLRAVEDGSTALYAEYTLLYPAINAMFDEDVICQLVKVDLYRKIKKYSFVSFNFTYKEEFKIGTLRAIETGILKRLIGMDRIIEPYCETKSVVLTQLEHIFMPLSLLGLSYVISLTLLVVENISFSTKKIFPYLE